MDDKKIIKIHNKSDKPDNIVFKENVLIERCIKVENKLPKFMKDYFIYLKGSVATSTRLAYLDSHLSNSLLFIYHLFPIFKENVQSFDFINSLAFV